jgi:hypothetical protein
MSPFFSSVTSSLVVPAHTENRLLGCSIALRMVSVGTSRLPTPWVMPILTPRPLRRWRARVGTRRHEPATTPSCTSRKVLKRPAPTSRPHLATHLFGRKDFRNAQAKAGCAVSSDPGRTPKADRRRRSATSFGGVAPLTRQAVPGGARRALQSDRSVGSAPVPRVDSLP